MTRSRGNMQWFKEQNTVNAILASLLKMYMYFTVQNKTTITSCSV